MPGDPGPAASRPPPGWQTVPDPPQSLFSPRHLCFHIFLTVLLCLWFLIELPRSDTSSGCYIILSNSAPSAGHYLTATTPGLPGGQQSMTSLASIRWVEGWAGQEPRGAKHAMAGCDTVTCARAWHVMTRGQPAHATRKLCLVPQQLYQEICQQIMIF